MEDLLNMRVYKDEQTRGHSTGLWTDPIWEALSQHGKEDMFVRLHDRLSKQCRRTRVWDITPKALCLRYEWRNQLTVTVAVNMNSINFEIFPFNLRMRSTNTIQYDIFIKYGSKSCIWIRKPKSSPLHLRQQRIAHFCSERGWYRRLFHCHWWTTTVMWSWTHIWYTSGQCPQYMGIPKEIWCFHINNS